MKGTFIYTHPTGKRFEVTSADGTLYQWREVKTNEIEQPWQKAAWPFEELGNLIDHFDEKAEEDRAAFYSACIVLHNKSYGGPEEGGWWYDTYEPQIVPWAPLPVFVVTREEAEAWCDKQTLWCQEQNADRHPPSSMLSEGHYTTMIYEEEAPCIIPKEKPHYE